MKIAGILLLACASLQSVAMAAAAQTANFTRPLHIDPASCPVDLQAEQAGSLAQSKATYAFHGDVLPSTPGQRIRLTVTNRSSRDVVSAEITAHGFSDKGRLVPLSEAPTIPDLTKKIDLKLPLKGSSQASRELSLTRFTAVAAIDVDALTYADGTTWRAAFAGSCSVTPDFLMRVAASR